MAFLAFSASALADSACATSSFRVSVCCFFLATFNASSMSRMNASAASFAAFLAFARSSGLVTFSISAFALSAWYFAASARFISSIRPGSSLVVGSAFLIASASALAFSALLTKSLTSSGSLALAAAIASSAVLIALSARAVMVSFTFS